MKFPKVGDKVIIRKKASELKLEYFSTDSYINEEAMVVNTEKEDYMERNKGACLDVKVQMNDNLIFWTCSKVLESSSFSSFTKKNKRYLQIDQNF